MTTDARENQAHASRGTSSGRPPVEVDRWTFINLLALGIAANAAFKGECRATDEWLDRALEVMEGYLGDGI